MILALLLIAQVQMSGGSQSPHVSAPRSFKQPAASAAPRDPFDKLREIVSVKDFGACGDGVCDDTPALQSAHGAVSDGGTIFLPCGTYKITGEILLTKRIQVIGAGWCSVLQVAASVGSSTDVIRIAPTSGTPQGFRFQDFAISPASGTPARYGINIDGTSVAIGYLLIDHVRIDTLGNYAVAVTNASGLVTGTPYTTEIRHSLLSGGIDLTDAGDSVNIDATTLTGPRDLKVNLIGVAGSDGGAHGFMLTKSNITLVGGIVVVNAWQGTIAYNNIEQTVTSTGTNSAVIDLRGQATAPVQNFKIVGNLIGAATFATDTIRVDRAVATVIERNYVSRGSGVSYRLTANSDRTQILLNRQAPAGELMATWLADLGTNTQVDYLNPNTGLRTLTYPAIGNNAGTTQFSWSNTQGKAGSTSLWGFSSGADPTATGMDTGISRNGGTGLFAFGTGGFQAVDGSLFFQKMGLTATLQANLGTPVNGTVLYCSDCTIANPCAGGGTGAVAKRLNGVWVCN